MLLSWQLDDPLPLQLHGSAEKTSESMSKALEVATWKLYRVPERSNFSSHKPEPSQGFAGDEMTFGWFLHYSTVYIYISSI